MADHLSGTLEWHIFENPATTSSPEEHQAVHFGPFASEEQCRAALASLKQIPGLSHGNLEVHKKHPRREKRIRMRLAVRISRLAAPERNWPAHTVDVSTLGARLSEVAETMKLGEVLRICCGAREAVFRVVWAGLLETPTSGQIGVECLTPETNIWDLDFSARTDDEPLLQEIASARLVQRKFFPRRKPVLRTLDYSGKCIQARTVGGDYYDFLDMGSGRVGFVLADVAGKGVAAALLMANLQGSIHSGKDGTGDLRDLLASVNRHLYEHTEPAHYATLFFGCYDDSTRTLTYANCGHTAPLLLRTNGSLERLASTATVLGLFGTWDCTLAETRIGPGDVLSIFTDGITETTGADGEEFGEKRLMGTLQQSRILESAAILNQIEEAVGEFRCGEHLQDDLTLVVARGV